MITTLMTAGEMITMPMIAADLTPERGMGTMTAIARTKKGMRYAEIVTRTAIMTGIGTMTGTR